MRNLAMPLVVLAMLALPACGPSVSIPANTVLMGTSSFITRSLTVKAGTSVVFDNSRSSNGTHLLYTGANGMFQSQPGAPSALDSPDYVEFHPGDSRTFIFATPGTYTITCQIHPFMLVIIIVTL